MLIQKAFHTLTPPPPRDLAPILVTFGVWSAVADLDLVWMGFPVLPLWFALASGTLFWLIGRMPEFYDRAHGTPQKAAVIGMSAFLVFVILASSLSTQAWMIQSVWIAGSILYGLVFSVGVLMGDNEDLAMLCPRWAHAPDFTRTALWVIAIRNAFVALGAVILMNETQLTEWVVFVTLGKVAAYYIGEWFTVQAYLSRVA